MFNAESFGSDCPTNWEEICAYLNDKAAECNGDTSENDIWEAYWNGEYPDAPVASGVVKMLPYHGRVIELTSVRFNFMAEKTMQNGVLVHDSDDEYSNGDAIYGNGWTLDMINDESDLDTLFCSGDGTTYWHRNEDDTYTLDA